MAPALPAEGTSVALFAVVGAVGSVHCIGMCGPLVAVYADRMPGDDARGPTGTHLRQHLLFNLGRAAAYATLGALAGALGAGLYDAAALASAGTVVRGATGVAVGLLVVAAGLGYLLRGHGGVLPSVPLLAAPSRRVQAALRERVDGWVAGPRIAGLGAVHAVLPCPLLAPAYLYAFGTGSPVTGALALGALGLGTLPTLFVLGTVAGSIDPARRRRVHRAMGAAVVVLGAIPLYRGVSLLAGP